MPYQTFATVPGDSDSPAKWDRLRINPRSLRNAAVLDIGCNAGYFCETVHAAGASRVVGIDQNAELIQQAQSRPPLDGVEYRRQSWRDPLPDGPWDIVLFLSAIHYEPDQVGLFRRIHAGLAPGGMLALECGIAPTPGDTWQRCTRPGNSTVRFPSMDCLTRMLRAAGLVGRYVGRSVDQRGDAIPRHVFHIHARSPQMLIVSGRGRAGKSALCQSLGESCSVDHFTIRNAATERAPWTVHAHEIGLTRLLPFYESIASQPDMLAGFVESVMDCLPESDAVIVDSHELITPAIQTAAAARGYRVWTAQTEDA